MTRMTPAAMRARFHEAKAERAALEAQLAPKRARRDALAARIAALEAEIRPLNAELKVEQQPLFDLDMEIGMIVRALNGKTAAGSGRTGGGPSESVHSTRP